ncbi:MAG TPA: hypothetical protein DCP92_20805 [Nitrospiraceae bacterium]|nr:hypothetical protein [Nitrospiraceae bacterium]
MIESVREVVEILKYKEFLRNLVLRDIKVRYKRSVLGFIWVMLNPMLMMLILNMVFSGLFTASKKNYTSYLLAGIILWNFVSQSTSTSRTSFLGNRSLINKIYMPKAIFPLSVVISATINFIFSLVPLFIILYLNGTSISHNIFLLPLLIILVALFSFGIALILSTLTVFFHDAIYIYEVVLLAWMYVTPIFYPESIVPQKFIFILHMNPLYYFVNIFRGSLSMEVSFLSEKLLYAFLFSLASLSLGWLFYDRYKDRIPYYL